MAVVTSLYRQDFNEIATALREARMRLQGSPTMSAAWALYGVEVDLVAYLKTTNVDFNERTFRDAARPHDWFKDALKLYGAGHDPLPSPSPTEGK